MTDTKYGAIPTATLTTLVDYFQKRVPPGAFTRAVLENDLMGAFLQADEANAEAIHAIMAWMRNEAPARTYGSWGSPEAVRNHLEKERELREDSIEEKMAHDDFEADLEEQAFDAEIWD